MTTFPASPLPIKVEILINGTWTDITHFVYTDPSRQGTVSDPANSIVITGGQQDQSAKAQPAQATMTLNNSDGRFSPLYTGGAYYPFLQRNTQLRISLVNATSATSNVYSGFRFWGEVSDWPPMSDLTGNDKYVQITASGPFRRLAKGGGKGSALTRYYATLTGASAPIAYWPCEDDPYTNSIGTALQGGTNMAVTSGTPFWASDSNFDGSLPVLIINKAVLTGLTGSTTATTTNVVRFVSFLPTHGSNEFGALLQINTNGTVAKMLVYYRKGGKLQLRGFNGAGANIFDSGQIATNLDGKAVMVSVELTTSGANVNWALRTILPGATTFNSQTTGTVTTASVSYVTQVVVDPNANVVSTSIGHISVQNTLIPLTTVSPKLNGHTSELGIDRLIRLCNEEAFGAIAEYSETNDHWGFETGTQSWGAGNGAVTQSAVSVAGWPTDGTNSLLLTCNGAGTPNAHSPTGTSGKPVLPGDIVTAAVDVYTPAATAHNLNVDINWYSAAGALLSFAAGPSQAFGSGQISTLTVKGTAPAGAAFFALVLLSGGTEANLTLIYLDNVRVHPRMGPQTAKRLHELAEEIQDLDQGILKEAKELWGLKFKTRISLINQTPALTLNYAAGHLAAGNLTNNTLAPVSDDLLTKNHAVVHRHKGSKVDIAVTAGSMSVQEPPNGVGRYKKVVHLAAEDDAQLLAYASHLLAIGTDINERYPQVEVDMTRPEVANLFSAIGGMECGEYLQIVNLPFWYPNPTAKQLVIGYTETLSNYEWDIVWNCRPENPFEIISTSLRRW